MEPGPAVHPEARVLIGMGANIGDPVAQLRAALDRLRGVVSIDRVSSLYRTEPVGYRDQPDFFNLVLSGRTPLPPRRLLAATQRIERGLGRRRSFRNAPRSLDIDLLAYADLVLDTPSLVLPHPRLHERGFVLLPLLEIEPEWRHPRTGAGLAAMISALAGGQRVERCRAGAP